MEFKLRHIIFFILTGATVFSSCATIFESKSTQLVCFDPDQKETEIYINGVFMGHSPISVELKLSEGYEISYVKPSYVQENFVVQKGINPKWLLADILCVPLTVFIPLVIDSKTKSWEYFQVKSFPSELTSWLDITEPMNYLNSRFQLGNLYFRIDNPEIDPESYGNLDKLVSILRDNPDIKLLMHSYSGEFGDTEQATKLIKERVNAVIRYMVENGLNGNQILVEDSSLKKSPQSIDSEAMVDKKWGIEFEFVL